MSLVKSPRLTEKKVAANERNRKLSRGPVTAAGRERIRAAHLRHGFYAQAEEVALRALGEEPARFKELLERLWAKWDPTDALQEELVARLARAVWRAKRADRMQEGYALRQAQEVNNSRENRLHAHLMRLKMTSASLQLLAQSVAREHYVTAPGDLGLMKSLIQEGEVKEMGEIALALFYQLREPGALGPGELEEDARRRRSEAQTRAALVRFQEIFGLHGDHPPGVKVAPASGQPQAGQPDASTPRESPPAAVATKAVEKERYPNITAQEWDAREPVRQLLENILTRQAELCEAQRYVTLRESLAGPSPYERAAEIAPAHANAMLVQRMEDSNFRQVVRVTSLLIRIKRQERQMEAFREDDEPWRHRGFRRYTRNKRG